MTPIADTLKNLVNVMIGNVGNLVTKLKEKRFTSTARVLGDKKALGVRVQVVDAPSAGAAWWDAHNRIITLNDAIPKTNDSKLLLIWERAKLFHELFHVLFTTNDRLRMDFFKKSNNGDRYLWVSNALEDGRIEHFGGMIFAGTTWYIRTLIKVLITSNNPDTGLLLYVRTRKWRNAKERKFWAKYITLIDECITAPNSDIVWTHANTIVQDMEKPQPKPPPPQGKPEPTEDDGEKGNPQPSEENEQDEQDSDDDGDNEGGSESSEDDSESDDEPEADQESGEGSDNDGGDSDDDEGDAGDPAAPPTPDTSKMDREIEQELKELIKEAMEQINDEVEEELIEIDREVADYVVEQEYRDNREANLADQLTELFASILVDSKRQRFQSCKRGGTLDTKRLLETQTGGEYMHESINKASQPHIVLLIDLSFSMDWQRPALTAAARILHGSIAASGAKGITFTFGAHQYNQKVDCYSAVPDLFDSGYGTPTDVGLMAAREWLNEEQAKRGMVIVITDGEPNNVKRAAVQFDELSNEGYYVLNVLLGATPSMVKTMKTMCHDYVCVRDATGLVATLEEPIGNFMSGAF